MGFMKTTTRALIGASIEGHKVVRHLSKLAKLQLLLKIEKERQKSTYKEMGAYIHTHANADVLATPKVNQFKKQLKAQEEKMIELVDQINHTKKINRCSYCGHVAREAFKFCPRCKGARK